MLSGHDTPPTHIDELVEHWTILDEAVREVIFPAVSGGEQTLRELVHEFKTNGPVYRATVQTTLRASYTKHYRRGLIELLKALEFRCGNTVYQPVITALEPIRRYAKAGNTSYYPLGEVVAEQIATSQQREIDEMKEILTRL